MRPVRAPHGRTLQLDEPLIEHGSARLLGRSEGGGANLLHQSWVVLSGVDRDRGFQVRVKPPVVKLADPTQALRRPSGC